MGAKNAKQPFSVQNRTSLEESLLQFLRVKTVSYKVVTHPFTYLSVYI